MAKKELQLLSFDFLFTFFQLSVCPATSGQPHIDCIKPDCNMQSDNK